MTPEERRLLTDLAAKIAQTPPPPLDAEAEDFIRKNIGNRPDALYLMTQTVLIQNMAIQLEAQQQIQDLQQRAVPIRLSFARLRRSGSFLGQQPQQQQQPQYALRATFSRLCSGLLRPIRGSQRLAAVRAFCAGPHKRQQASRPEP